MAALSGSPAFEPINGDAQIEQISVGGNWIASTVAAGAIVGPDGLFGTADDAIRFPHVNSVTAKIASIHISGKARGTPTPTLDHFGFVAEEIGELKIGGKAVHLLSGSSNDNDPTTPGLALGTDSDMRIMEISSLAPPPNLLAAVSRKMHGTSDVNIVRAFTVPGTIGATNFRTHLDLSGQVDAEDVSAVRSSSGNQLD